MAGVGDDFRSHEKRSHAPIPCHSNHHARNGEHRHKKVGDGNFLYNLIAAIGLIAPLSADIITAGNPRLSGQRYRRPGFPIMLPLKIRNKSLWN